jgi:hypothetical protein
MPKKQDSPDVVGSQKAYDDFLPEAQKIPDASVRPFRADASLAHQNVQRGLTALVPLLDNIKDELPKVNIADLQKLPDLALAVIYAAAQVDRGSDGTTAALLEKARGLRDMLLKSAEALAAAGLVPERPVTKIRAGNGLIDTAQDNVDLAALFMKHEKGIKGKTAVTAAHVKEAAAVGTELLKRLKPKGTKAKDPALDAVRTRDRLWTLLVTRHRELRRVGMWFWMEEVDNQVPALQARRVVAKKKPNPTAEGAAAATPG